MPYFSHMEECSDLLFRSVTISNFCLRERRTIVFFFVITEGCKRCCTLFFLLLMSALMPFFVEVAEGGLLGISSDSEVTFREFAGIA